MKGKIQTSTLPFLYKLYIKVIENVHQGKESSFLIEIFQQIIENYGI